MIFERQYARGCQIKARQLLWKWAFFVGVVSSVPVAIAVCDSSIISDIVRYIMGDLAPEMAPDSWRSFPLPEAGSPPSFALREII